MSSRNYGQACSVAHFLDHLGNRWTLLIIRDLLIGPRRFKDLLEGLPGIGPNLLTSRLGELAEAGIIEKNRDPGSKASVYVLTQKGWDLEPVVLAMARWSLQYPSWDSARKLRRPDLLVVAFRAAFQAERATGLNESYELRIGDVIFYARIDDGQLETGLGPADQPAMIFITDGDTFDQIVNGEIDEKTARDRGVLKIVGDKQAYLRFLDQFSTPAPTPD